MTIKKITEDTFCLFAKNHSLTSFYQSIQWKRIKEKENKKCELVGLYEKEKLIGVSLIIYVLVLKKYYIAYSSRGFLYDYSNIKSFSDALKEYFKDKAIIAFRMDPPVILSTYDKDLNKTENTNGKKVLTELTKNGFVHFGFNQAFETMQFRFVHRISLKNSYDETYSEMSKSTKKNIEIAEFLGVKSEEITIDELDKAIKFFELSEKRKKIDVLSKKFYENILTEFSHANLYLYYIDKEIALDNINNKLLDLNEELKKIENQFANCNVGKKLQTQKNIIVKGIEKWSNELLHIKDYDSKTYIAAMLTITNNSEVVSLVSGMDINYKNFRPKYIMYPDMIKKAYKDNLKYVNFLGIKNIFNTADPDYGIYEVKKGFGGQTIEYIGEFDLPLNKRVYKIYKLMKKIRRK